MRGVDNTQAKPKERTLFDPLCGHGTVSPIAPDGRHPTFVRFVLTAKNRFNGLCDGHV
jgi:hypothetical protein